MLLRTEHVPIVCCRCEGRPFPHVNDYRNPIIAEALKNLGYVNMFNRGVSRVKELFKENGNPPIDFNVDKITVFEVVVKPNS